MRLPSPARWTLLRKFTVLSLVCFAVLGIALAQLLAHQIRQRALSNTVASAQLLSSTLASTQLAAGDLAHGVDPARAKALDGAVAQARAQHRLARLKIWGRDGGVGYPPPPPALGP